MVEQAAMRPPSPPAGLAAPAAVAAALVARGAVEALRQQPLEEDPPQVAVAHVGSA